MTEFTDEELRDIVQLCESRVRTTQFIKAEVPAVSNARDLVVSGTISQKCVAIVSERAEAEKKKQQEPKKD